MVKININGNDVEADPKETIMDVAFRIGLDIPHFCYEEKISKPAGCRMCVVEIEGARTLVPSCSTAVREGMVIKTHSKKVLDSRRMTLQLLISNHPSCLSCSRNLNCKLQKYSEELMIDERRFKPNRDKKGESNVILTRDNSLCILCGQCVRYCDEIQSVHAIDFVKRGVKTFISTALEMPIEKSVCVGCGQCVLHCPTGALNESYEVDPVIELLNNKEQLGKKMVVAQVAPSVRVTAGELFGYEAGTVVTGKIVTALKKAGFDKVFDTVYGADLTIMEEANELVERLNGKGKLPMFTSCCPGWVKFVENFYPEYLENLSSCKSPQQMESAIIKSYFAKKEGLKPKDIAIVSVMPCTAKKFEKTRLEASNNGLYATDQVITTREFGKLCNMLAIDFKDLDNSDFDRALGESSGAGDLFGNTGGVMEAALRTAYETQTGKTLEKVEFDQIRGYNGIKEGSIVVNGTEINFAVAHGLSNARKLMDDIKQGKSKYHFIEVMACPGGCIGGGGQPRPTSVKNIKKRIEGLYSIDHSKTIRRCHENPLIIDLYSNYLKKQGSKKAHELLHTTFVERDIWDISNLNLGKKE
jgi:iron-only hydrogenase group A